MGHEMLSTRQWTTVSFQLGLSARELDILKLVFDDCKERTMGQNLGISTHTVHTHLERLYRKLGVHSRCGAVLRVFDVVLGVRS